MAELAVKGLCEVVLEAGDLEPMVEFYEGLGMPVLSREDDRVWLAASPDSRLGIWTPGRKEHDDRGGRHVHFALSVTANTLDAQAERLRATGADVKGPVEHDGGDRSLYVFDPEGNRLELWDFFEDGAGEEEGVRALV